MKTARSTVTDINCYLDEFSSAEGINYPEIEHVNQSDEKASDTSFSEESDKENSIETTGEDSREEYFSPNIQIRKSTNMDVYTPALKFSSNRK
jgi:hypothetical protein